MFLGSSLKTLISLGGSSKDSLIHVSGTNLLIKKTCRLFSLEADDFYNDSYILYRDDEKKKKDNILPNAVLFICLDLGSSINDLNNVCSLFRQHFMAEYKINNESDYCNVENLLWISEVDFNDIIKNTVFIDIEDDFITEKTSANGNIPIPSSLAKIYALKENEFPITETYNERSNAPPYLSTYPKIDPYLQVILLDAINQNISLFP